MHKYINDPKQLRSIMDFSFPPFEIELDTAVEPPDYFNPDNLTACLLQNNDAYPYQRVVALYAFFAFSLWDGDKKRARTAARLCCAILAYHADKQSPQKKVLVQGELYAVSTIVSKRNVSKLQRALFDSIGGALSLINEPSIKEFYRNIYGRLNKLRIALDLIAFLEKAARIDKSLVVTPIAFRSISLNVFNRLDGYGFLPRSSAKMNGVSEDSADLGAKSEIVGALKARNLDSPKKPDNIAKYKAEMTCAERTAVGDRTITTTAHGVREHWKAAPDKIYLIYAITSRLDFLYMNPASIQILARAIIYVENNSKLFRQILSWNSDVNHKITNNGAPTNSSLKRFARQSILSEENTKIWAATFTKDEFEIVLSVAQNVRPKIFTADHIAHLREKHKLASTPAIR